jgi:hypothetical protein
MGVLEQYIIELQKTKEPRFSFITKQGPTFSYITLYGRWIIIYQGSDITIDDDEMHIFDFRIDLKSENNGIIFSEEIMDAFTQIQTDYIKVFTAESDFVELTYAEPCEKVANQFFLSATVMTWFPKSRNLRYFRCRSRFKEK